MTQIADSTVTTVAPLNILTLNNQLNNIIAAFLSNQSGTTEPAEKDQGSVWYDMTQALSSPAYIIAKVYDGADWIEMYRINMTSNRVEGPLSYTAVPEPEVVASAATANIGATKTAQVLISGTTTITSFGTVANQLRFVRFAGALTLTHDATTLILPGGANITTAAGDTATAISDASGNWRVIAFQKADGNPVIALAKPLGRRQTVYSGPVDTNGFSSFGGSTGGTSLTASGTIRVTAAGGFDASGPVDRIGSITDPVFSGTTTNGKMYLYFDVQPNGACTPGTSTLAPTYRWGGADVVTNNQFTFNIQEMVGKVGNGTTAAQVWRVFVGEVTVASGVVSAIVWYAINGRYNSGWYSVVTSTTYNRAANIGVPPEFINVSNLYRQSSSYVPRKLEFVSYAGAAYGCAVGAIDSTNVRVRTGDGGVSGTSGELSNVFGSNDGSTYTSGQYLTTAERAW